MSREDNIIDSIVSELNKGNKKKLAYNLAVDESPSTVNYWISTGAPNLDMIISNKETGGFPSGKMVLLSGLESSGKSLIATHALANAQKMGGIAVFIDAESSVHKLFLQGIGVDLNELVYVTTRDMEKAFKTVEQICKWAIENDFTGPIIIVMDSIAAMTLQQYNDNIGEQVGYEGAKRAQFISNQLPKIIEDTGLHNVCLVMVTQQRQKIGAMANEFQFSEVGGLALKFYASLHIRLKRSLKLMSKDKKDQIGLIVTAETTKNKLAPERRKVKIPVYYDRGIDYNECIYKDACDEDLFIGKTWKTYITDDGEEIKFQSMEKLLELGGTEVIEEIRKKLFVKKRKYYKGEEQLLTEMENIDDN